MAPQGYLDSYRLAPLPNYSKALPPTPPVYSYPKRSSSVYSQGTELCHPQPSTPILAAFTLRPILDKSNQRSPPPPPPRFPYKKLSITRLPQGDSTAIIQTQRPLLLGPSSTIYRASPPSLTEVEIFLPIKTRRRQVYSGFWLDSTLPTTIGPRLLEPFDLELLCRQNDSDREARACGRSTTPTCASLKHIIPSVGSVPGNIGSADKDTAVILSSVYQYYLTDEFEGEPGQLQKQGEDKSSQLKVEKELHTRDLGRPPTIEISQRLPRLTPLEGEPVAKTADFAQPSPLTSQDQGLPPRARTLHQDEGVVLTEPQQATTLLPTLYGKRLKGTPNSGPPISHHSLLTNDLEEDDMLLDSLPERSRSAGYTFPIHTEDAATQRRGRGGVVEKGQSYKAYNTVDDVLRYLEGGSESPALALEGCAPSTARALPGNRARTWMYSECPNTSAPDFLSVERRPVTVPRDSNSRGAVLPIRAELDYMPYQGDVNESRFSVDSPKASLSHKALPSFLSGVLHFRSLNLNSRRGERHSSKRIPVDIPLGPKRGGRGPDRSKDVEVSNWL